MCALSANPAKGKRLKPQLWFLEGYLDRNRSLRRMPVADFPYRMGRQADLSLTLDSTEISRVHAEIVKKNGVLLIRDLGSTNGTFVNHEPVTRDTRLRDGDIIHLATVELRLVGLDSDQLPSANTTRHGLGPLSAELPVGTRYLQELLLNERVTAAFQPIFEIDGTIHGWEILGRGAHPKLSGKPMDLFRIAESVGLEVMLSDAFRRVGVSLASEYHHAGTYFVNTHPQETEEPEHFVRTMETLRGRFPDLGIVVELHEAAFADVKALNKLREQLAALEMKLAFDDFGAGRARIVELSDAPPDYIKLDISLVRDLDKASAARREMVEMMLDFAHKRNILTVAEGVSRAGEERVCREMGFDLLQGFHLGKPKSAENFAA